MIIALCHPRHSDHCLAGTAMSGALSGKGDTSATPVTIEQYRHRNQLAISVVTGTSLGVCFSCHAAQTKGVKADLSRNLPGLGTTLPYSNFDVYKL